MKHSPGVMVEMKKLLHQPSFVLAASVLLAAAISLNAATEFMQLYFKKFPVQLSRELTTIPEHLGHWVQVSKDERLEPDMEHVLAATNYLYRDYVDDRQVRPEEISKFEGKSYQERKGLLAQLQQRQPSAVINVGITYYTGMVDTVAHIPDRCYIADGFEPSSYNVVSWSAFDDRPGRAAKKEDVRYINFEDQVAARQSSPRNVAYLFHANGEYTCDPLGVRLRLQDLTQRYSYYAKIELMTVMRDADASAKMMNDFLAGALPEIEQCLPDWKNVIASAKGR